MLRMANKSIGSELKKKMKFELGIESTTYVFLAWVTDGAIRLCHSI